LEPISVIHFACLYPLGINVQSTEFLLLASTCPVRTEIITF